MRIIACAATSYLTRRGFPAGPAALVDHDCIIDTNFRDPGVWRFRTPEGEPVRVAVHGRLRFSNPEVCIAAAVAGLGVARVPSFIAGPRIAGGELIQVLGAFELPPSGLFVVYPPGAIWRRGCGRWSISCPSTSAACRAGTRAGDSIHSNSERKSILNWIL